MSTVSIRNLSKKYSSRQALKDVSFEIADNELTVVTGLKECGKTTLVRAICGLDTIEKGEVYIDGVLANKLEPKDRNIALVTTAIPLNANASVFDNMAVGLKLRKYPKEEIESKVLKAAEILGLTDYVRRLTKNLTPGQKYRLLLARAICREPKIVIIDNLLSGVEAGLRKELRTEIVKLNRRLNINFIYTTDSPIEALTMADNVAFLEEGALTQCGKPSVLYSEPKTLPIATFFGSPKINLFNGNLEKEGDKFFAKFQGYRVLTNLTLDGEGEKRYIEKQKEVTFAVRAEDFVVTDDGEITATVDDCDAWGESKYLSVLYSDKIESPVYFNAFLNAEQGATLKLSVLKERLLCFDTETEERIF